MTRREPGAYPRRILLAVTGLWPQVVTETLYALAVSGQDRFVPTELWVITTAKGAERARLTLLSRNPGWLQRLRRDYALPEIAFDPTHILVPLGENGVALEDLRCAQDNARAADLITDAVRALTADPDSALHVSIAGGRKTMGFYAGYALSMFGRDQDRLSHVLVQPEFEGCPQFFYPPPTSRVIHTRGPRSRPLDARAARVSLAEIPFVRLRHGLDERLKDGHATFSEAVAAAQRALGPAELVLDLPGRRVRAAGVVLRLPPSLLAFLSWLARRAQAGAGPVSCPTAGVPEPDYAAAYLAEYRAIIGEMGDDSRAAGRLVRGMDKAFFEQTKSKLNSALRKALGPVAASYLVDDGGTRPRRFALTLQAQSIRYEALEP